MTAKRLTDEVMKLFKTPYEGVSVQQLDLHFLGRLFNREGKYTPLVGDDGSVVFRVPEEGEWFADVIGGMSLRQGLSSIDGTDKRRVILRKVDEDPLTVYGVPASKLLTLVPEGYEAVMEGGKPAYREPKIHEWFRDSERQSALQKPVDWATFGPRLILKKKITKPDIVFRYVGHRQAKPGEWFKYSDVDICSWTSDHDTQNEYDIYEKVTNE